MLKWPKLAESRASLPPLARSRFGPLELVSAIFGPFEYSAQTVKIHYSGQNDSALSNPAQRSTTRMPKEQVDLHSHVLLSVPWICNRWAKRDYRAVVKIYIKKNQIFYEFRLFWYFFYFGRIFGFRPFESYGHLAIWSFGHLNIGLYHLYRQNHTLF
jgi:hypothetical protein